MGKLSKIKEEIAMCYGTLTSLQGTPEREEEYYLLLQELAELQRAATEEWQQCIKGPSSLQ